MKLQIQKLLFDAISEGVYVGLAKTFPGNGLLAIGSEDIVEQITGEILNRINGVIKFNDEETIYFGSDVRCPGEQRSGV